MGVKSENQPGKRGMAWDGDMVLIRIDDDAKTRQTSRGGFVERKAVCVGVWVRVHD